MGKVHCQRSTSALAGSPENMRGYGPTSRTSAVLRFRRVRNDPLLPPAKKTSGSRDPARCSRVRILRRCRSAVRRPGRLRRIRGRPAGAPATGLPRRGRDRDGHVARDADRAAVLLRAADVIRHVRGRDGVVELPGRVIALRPGALRRSGVVADRPAAVARVHDVLRVVRIDPQIVRVAAREAHHRLAAVGGLERPDVEHVDGVLLLRVRGRRACNRTRVAGCCGLRSPASRSPRRRPS